MQEIQKWRRKKNLLYLAHNFLFSQHPIESMDGVLRSFEKSFSCFFLRRRRQSTVRLVGFSGTDGEALIHFTLIPKKSV
jgi:hypothetical protein